MLELSTSGSVGGGWWAPGSGRRRKCGAWPALLASPYPDPARSWRAFDRMGLLGVPGFARGALDQLFGLLRFGAKALQRGQASPFR
jgi:hypothetical protein